MKGADKGCNDIANKLENGIITALGTSNTKGLSIPVLDYGLDNASVNFELGLFLQNA